MIGWLILLSGLLLGVVILQVVTYKRLSRREGLLKSQTHKIQAQNLELEQKRRLLDETNQEKNQIITLLSHDLKGPFNRIFALIQLMGMDSANLTDDQRDYVDKIHQMTVDGLGMVRNLLDHRKLEEDQFELVLNPVELSKLVVSIARTYESLAMKKKIKLEYDVEDNIQIKTDKLYITRALDNLISNAIKFSQPEKNVYLRLRQSEENVELIVQDEGPGISESDQQKLFQKYQKLTAKPTGGESSTGLGLYIVKNMVDKLKGTIRCESEEGKGARFIIQLSKQAS